MSRLLIALLALLVAAPAAAQPDAGGAPADALVVGVYAPWMYFPNSLARSQYVGELAERLGRVTGKSFRARAFATEGEFQNQIAAGQVHFAIVDAQYQIERGLKPLAQGVKSGRPTRPMVLVASGARGVAELEGKSLARVRLGRGDQGFIFNYLLQNQVDPGFFADGAGKDARDVQGALGLVKLGKADAAFAYKGTEPGIFETRPVPLPVFVATAADIAPDTLRAVQQGVLGVTLDGPVEGFSAWSAELHRPLERAIKAKPQGPGNRPVLSRADAPLPPVPSAIDTSATARAALPPVADELEVLPPPPDLY